MRDLAGRQSSSKAKARSPTRSGFVDPPDDLVAVERLKSSGTPSGMRSHSTMITFR